MCRRFIVPKMCLVELFFGAKVWTLEGVSRSLPKRPPFVSSFVVARDAQNFVLGLSENSIRNILFSRTTQIWIQSLSLYTPHILNLHRVQLKMNILSGYFKINFDWRKAY